MQISFDFHNWAKKYAIRLQVYKLFDTKTFFIFFIFKIIIIFFNFSDAKNLFGGNINEQRNIFQFHDFNRLLCDFQS